MLNVQIFAPINPTGVGTHSQYLLNELVKLCKDGKINLSIRPVGVVRYSTQRQIRTDVSSFMLANDEDEDKTDVTIVLNVPKKCDEWFEENKEFECGMRIAYTVFELEPSLDKYDEPNCSREQYWSSLRALDRFDQIWVPSKWARDVLVNDIELNPAKVFVLHEGITDFGVITEIHSQSMVFGNIGKFEKRKGHHAIVDALNRFDDEKINLVMVGWWHNFWNKNAASNYLMNAKFNIVSNGPGGSTFRSKNGYVTVQIPAFDNWQEDMASAWSRIDCMVYPTFSEGWGLPIGDSIGLGVPTLATENTGSNTFVAPYLSKVQTSCAMNFRIASEVLPELAYDPPFFNNQGLWYQTNRDLVYDGMYRYIDIYLRQKDDRVLKRIARDMKDEFSWKKSAESLLRLLGVSLF